MIYGFFCFHIGDYEGYLYGINFISDGANKYIGFSFRNIFYGIGKRVR